ALHKKPQYIYTGFSSNSQGGNGRKANPTPTPEAFYSKRVVIRRVCERHLVNILGLHCSTPILRRKI
ncbi:MAG TPA: hypothetical protein PLV03_10890, partial [Clostridiales bacterium]|nr:hypothetical protein [Clostridiales bacterium]